MMRLQLFIKKHLNTFATVGFLQRHPYEVRSAAPKEELPSHTNATQTDRKLTTACRETDDAIELLSLSLLRKKV